MNGRPVAVGATLRRDDFLPAQRVRSAGGLSRPSLSYWQDAWIRLARNRQALASLVIVWRFSRSRMFSAAAETRAQKLVAIQFFLLAPYVGVESVRALIGGERPDETWVGIALATSSVVLMPMLGVAKQRIADEIGSAATKGMPIAVPIDTPQ